MARRRVGAGGEAVAGRLGAGRKSDAGTLRIRGGADDVESLTVDTSSGSDRHLSACLVLRVCLI